MPSERLGEMLKADAATNICNALLNHPVEVSTLRPQLANYLGVGHRERRRQAERGLPLALAR